jgi:hypothetical protein
MMVVLDRGNGVYAEWALPSLKFFRNRGAAAHVLITPKTFPNRTWDLPVAMALRSDHK